MASTYVNDLRIEEINPGEQDGTWGTSLNTALEQICDGFGYGTQQFASDANETFTIADGATDGLRSMYVKFTSSGTLTATRTATIAPNTVNKVYIIENATTGGQDIIVSQGSGATVTIASGEARIVYTDGGGAGGAVTEAVVGGYPTTVDNSSFTNDASHEVSWATTYKRIEIELRNVIPATDGVNPVFKVSSDAGSTYREGATSYKNGATEATSITATLSIGSDANEVGVSGFVNIFVPANATYHLISWRLSYIDSSGNVQESTDTWAVQHAEDITGYKFEFSSGNIESGTIVTKGITS